jgi:hypothetical protein
MYDPFNKKLFHKIENAHAHSINVARFISDTLLVRPLLCAIYYYSYSLFFLVVNILFFINLIRPPPQVTGSDDETLKLFDTRFPGRCLNVFHGHRSNLIATLSCCKALMTMILFVFAVGGSRTWKCSVTAN